MTRLASADQPESRQTRDDDYGESRSPAWSGRSSLLALRPTWGSRPPDPTPASTW